MDQDDSIRIVMGSSFVNINVHLIFHIKSNACLIREEDLSRVFRYIGGSIRAMSGYAYIVGGQPDHIHILASLPASLRLSDFVRDIKSNTSKWIKSIDCCYEKFSWQEGYGAFSVSESNKDTVINYIVNQAEHHRTHSALDEFCQFLKKHGGDVEEWLCKHSGDRS
ncbi:MAG: transposase [Akkermansia sp.]|nr:transposase [Akkermansia sp.]